MKRIFDYEMINPSIIDTLLIDRTTSKNIIWATDDYVKINEACSFNSPILADMTTLIVPRVEKEKSFQTIRSKLKAEVFTPSWVCNKQINSIDDAWFGKHTNRFNKELSQTWESTYPRKNKKDLRDRIKFPKDKTWEDYVCSNRLEISCGEAPYLTSRYDTVTGKYIKPKNRIGMLDRKLRVITENVSGKDEWIDWAKKALCSTYGFDWQGDNVFLARQNMLLSVIEYCEELFNVVPSEKDIQDFAEIISWNIWQMDGIKYVLPNSCHKAIESKTQYTLDGSIESDAVSECPGCKSGNKFHHNGVYSKIMDWEEKKTIRFVDIYGGGLL